MRRLIAVAIAGLVLGGHPHAQRPAGQIVVNPTGTSATWFFDQSASSLATIQQTYSYRYYIDANTTPIALPVTCAEPPSGSGYPCQGQMSTIASGSHDYTLEVVCSSGCTPSSTKALPVSYNLAGNNGLVAPTGLRVESASGSQIPPLASIVDGAGATWTQGAPPAACPPSVASSHPPSDCAPQMRNGTVVGLGSSILYKNATVYVQGPSGTETHWWKYNGPNDWTDVGTAKP